MNIDRALRDVYSGVRRDDSARIGLRKDALFDLLSDGRRRYVIEHLADDGATPWEDLAVEIAASETHMRRDQVPRRRIEQVEADLRDEQLPRLVDAGVIGWEEDGEVRPGHSIEEIARLLREIDRRTERDDRAGAPFGFGGPPLGTGARRSQSNRRRHHP